MAPGVSAEHLNEPLEDRGGPVPEFELENLAAIDRGNARPYFARIRHTEAEYGWKRRVDTRKLQLDWNVTGLPRFWHVRTGGFQGFEGSRGSKGSGFSGSGFERARAPDS